MPPPEQPPSPDNNQLLPPSSRSAPSSSVLADLYLASPSPRTAQSFAQQQKSSSTSHPTALTTALDRPLSPSSSLGSPSTEAGGSAAHGLQRRSSTRSRRASESAESMGGLSTGEAGGGETANEDNEAVRAGRARTASEQGWRTFREATEDEGVTARERPEREGTVEMSDGSIVRRLPAVPSQHLEQPQPTYPSSGHLSASTSSASLSFVDDPFRSSAPPAPGLFSSSYTVSAPTAVPLSRVESHPLSLAELTDQPLGVPRRQNSGSSSDELDEEIQARSPLQPTHFPHSSSASRSPSVSPNRQRPTPQRRARLPSPSNVAARVKRSPFLAPLQIPGGSPSGAHASASSGISPGDSRRISLGAAGWAQLSPARSPGGDSPAKSPLFARRGTLSAVAGGLRRMSVRVVNVTGAPDDEDEEEAAEGDTSRLSGASGLTRSPSGLRNRRRSSAVTLAERRASKSATAAAGLGDAPGLRISEEEEEEEANVGTLKDEGLAGEEGGEGEKTEKWEKAQEKSERQYRQLRGNTLGVFGPENPLRIACARVLTAPWTEPIILVLIILQVVVLTIQSSPNVYTSPRPTKGYFHAWEDYVLFAIFVCFTVEIAARILVTGLIFNPPRPPELPQPKVDLYGAGTNTPSRTPSIVTRIQSHLSPLPSPTSHRGFAHGLSLSPSRTRVASHTPTTPTSPSGQGLYPVPLSPIKDPGTYPPGSSTDIASLGYSSHFNADDGRGQSSVSLVRDNSHAPLTPTSSRPAAPGTGIGLGLSAPPGSTSTLALAATASNSSDPFSIRSALASTVPTAAGAASSASFLAPPASPAGRGKAFRSNTTPYALSIKRQRQTYQQAFLRHSWNRIDFVAVLSFWIAFALAQTGAEAGKNLWCFRALSVIRSLRLLAVTAGTQTILQSLKKASPLLVDVGIFVAFAMVLFSIIGVQAFRGSYRRTCQWIDPTGVFDNVTASDQHCGGFIDPVSGNQTGYLLSNYQPSNEPPKGFICGVPSVCVETSNPMNGAWSFDNIFASLMQVFIVASANTWTTPMYDMMDADYFVSCLFFIACLVVVNYWLFSLFVACITSTFADIRDETRHSAFATTSVVPTTTKFDDDRKPHRAFTRSTSLVRKVYDKTAFVWILAIIASVGIQAARSYGRSQQLENTFQWVELGLTFAFDVEIALRFFASLPDWRAFFTESKTNCVDTFLAVATSIIQIPVIRQSDAFRWLTIFQLARFYRVILFIPRMRRLLNRVLGTFTGLINMGVFLLMMNFVSALIACQLLRGIPDPENDDTGVVDWDQMYNGFLAMYQILSSENWTDVLKTAVSNQGSSEFQIVLTCVFLCGWMFFSFFILGNMFIAVLNENFAMAEEEKRARQAEAFVNRPIPGQTITAGWFRRFDPYTYVSKARRKNSRQNSADLLTDNAAPPAGHSRTGTVSSIELVEEPEELPDRGLTASPDMMDESDEKSPPGSASATSTRFIEKAKKSIRFQSGIDSVVGYVDPKTPQPDRSRYRHPRDGTGHSREATFVEQARYQEVEQERRNQIEEFAVENPSYSRTLFFFTPASRVRRFCQSFTEAAYGGERINGRAPDKRRRLVFSSIVLLAIVASIAIAGIATPLYRRDYYLANGPKRWTWYNLCEAALGSIFFAEALVKWIADGFLFSPNAYLLSLWNDIDFFVLITLIVNISTSLAGGTSSSRFTRALKAFRALRLINLSPTMRTTFYNVLIVGAGRIMDASILAALYVVPYAVWGQNVFSGLLFSCTDSSVLTKAECAGEYLAETVEGWSYLAPRAWVNPELPAFDTFKSSLLILFEIISLEGWIDVMETVMQITGLDRQPQENASQWNALFFVIYNLVGAVFILTLFVSLIIQNFAERTSTSLLTAEQRQWLDLRRYIARQRPAKRPKHRPTSGFRAWCFDRAVSKHGWWSRSVTALYCLNILVLMTQAETTSAADDARNYIFLGFTILYLIDIVVRVSGLGVSFFRSGWNLYDLVVVTGTIATTLPILAGNTHQTALQLQKLFLVSIVLKLAQRNDSLNQLFKTAAASLPAILNIFALWLVLFLVYAIFYIELFGLTRWRSSSTHNSNYYTFFNALVLLALQSTGEGWNAYMHEYTVEWPHCTNSQSYLFSDCGSAPGAYALFITWNILSMYLFVNLLLGAVIENFGFAYQTYGGKVTSITREQMRGFKKVWGQFDPEQTGYLQPKDIGRFLHRLSSVFEVRIYREEWSLRNLQASARRDVTNQHASPAFYHYLADRNKLSLDKVDLDKLGRLIDGIDADEVRQRREIHLHVYHEAKLEADNSIKGISFTKMLTLIAHYRLIDDDSALQMDELAARHKKQQLVTERVQMDRLHSFLYMTVVRRRYLAQRQAARREEMGAPVPAIHVVGEGSPSPSPAASRFATPRSSFSPAQSSPEERGRSEGEGDESVLETPSRGGRPSVSFAAGPPRT
ncbi:hypothetical protein JCM8097_001819 [Rhodosporidiobolus ruineniae]